MWWDWCVAARGVPAVAHARRSKVTAKLVPSFVGRHEGWPTLIRVGHTALLKALRDLGADCPPNMKLTLECQGSSIGKYSTQWMNEFYCSARGEPSEKFTWIGNKSMREVSILQTRVAVANVPAAEAALPAYQDYFPVSAHRR